MRHNHQMRAPFQKRPNRRHQLVVEHVEVRFRRPLHRFHESLRILSAHPKFRELETQQLQCILNPRKHAHRNNFHFVSRDYHRNQPVARRIVFDERRVRRHALLQVAKRKIRWCFQRCVFTFVRRQFPQRPHQLFFVRLRLFLQPRDPVLGVVLRAELFQFNPVVIPIQVFPQVSDSPHQIALPCFAHRQALPASKNHFAHAAGLRRLNTRKRFRSGLLACRARQQNIHECFVHLQPVPSKRNFQLFRVNSRSQ